MQLIQKMCLKVSWPTLKSSAMNHLINYSSKLFIGGCLKLYMALPSLSRSLSLLFLFRGTEIRNICDFADIGWIISCLGSPRPYLPAPTRVHECPSHLSARSIGSHVISPREDQNVRSIVWTQTRRMWYFWLPALILVECDGKRVIGLQGIGSMNLWVPFPEGEYLLVVLSF